MQAKLRVGAKMAFEANDLDNNEQLDKGELSKILKSTAKSMKIKPPTDNDVEAVLGALDADKSEGVDPEEFEDLILLVLKKMADSEMELQTEVNKQVDARNSTANTQTQPSESNK